jgi:hypothetical protein
MKMTKILILSFLTLLSSCSHNKKKLLDETQIAGICADRLKDINPPKGQEIIDFSKQITAGTASIAIAGLGVATDAIVIVLTSPVTKVTVCLVAIAALTDGHGAGLDVCGIVAEPGHNPKLAQKSLDHTTGWRCPNLDYIAEGLRGVASCYLEHANKEKAKLQLDAILKNKTLSDCISDDEKSKIEVEMQKLSAD